MHASDKHLRKTYEISASVSLNRLSPKKKRMILIFSRRRSFKSEGSIVARTICKIGYFIETTTSAILSHLRNKSEKLTR